MSFNEKNAWACLLAIIAVYVPYFYFVSLEPLAGLGSIIWFVIAVVFLAVLLALFHTVNALFSPRIRKTGNTPPLDERDRHIDAFATKVSAIVLAIGVISWCINAMMRIPLAGFGNMIEVKSSEETVDLADMTISAIDALAWVQVLFFGFVLANAVYYATMIFCYRRSS